jgi:hypothetical protein
MLPAHRIAGVYLSCATSRSSSEVLIRTTVALRVLPSAWKDTMIFPSHGLLPPLLRRGCVPNGGNGLRPAGFTELVQFL